MPPTPRFLSVTTPDGIQAFKLVGDVHGAPSEVVQDLDYDELEGFEDLGPVGAPADYKHIYLAKKPPLLQRIPIRETTEGHKSPLPPSQACRHSVSPTRSSGKRPTVTVPPSPTKV